MTEEEIEEFAREISYDLNDPFCAILEKDKIEYAVKKGYEKGYEDCRHYAHDYYKTKWHDLRKDPDDLPKDEEDLKEYLVAYKNFNNPNEIVVGSFTWNGVRFLENYDYSEIPYFKKEGVLIAWCELPKFKE